MKFHVGYAAIAIVTFAWHLIAGLLTEVIFWLPEYLWFASIIFSVLAIYSGTATATRSEPDKRGLAIASAVTGGIVLWCLLLTGGSWLFLAGNGY